eukprot:ANDGO_07646.mRNA.1 hypothetical protein
MSGGGGVHATSLNVYDDLFVVPSRFKIRHVTVHPSRSWVAFSDENDDLFMYEFASQCKSQDPGNLFLVPLSSPNGQNSESLLRVPFSSDYVVPFSFAQHSTISVLDGKEVFMTSAAAGATPAQTSKNVVGKIRQILFHPSIARLVVLCENRLIIYDFAFPASLEPKGNASASPSLLLSSYADSLRRREVLPEVTKPLTSFVLLGSKANIAAVGCADGLLRFINCDTGTLDGLRIPPNGTSGGLESGAGLPPSASSHGLSTSSSSLKISSSMSSVNLSATHTGSTTSSGAAMGGAGNYSGIVRLALSDSETALFSSYADGSIVSYELRDDDDEGEEERFDHEEKGSLVPSAVVPRALAGPSAVVSSKDPQALITPPVVFVAFHSYTRYLFLSGAGVENCTLIARDVSQNYQFVWKYALPSAKGPIVGMALLFSYVLIVGKTSAMVLLDCQTGQLVWESEALFPPHQLKAKKKPKCYHADVRTDGVIALAGSTGLTIVKLPWRYAAPMMGGMPAIGRHRRDLFYVVGNSVFTRRISIETDSKVRMSKPLQVCKFSDPLPMPKPVTSVSEIAPTRWMSMQSSALWSAACPLHALSPLSRTLLCTMESGHRGIAVSPSRRYISIGSSIFEMDKGALVFHAPNCGNNSLCAWLSSSTQDSFALILDTNISLASAPDSSKDKKKKNKKDAKDAEATSESIHRLAVIYSILPGKERGSQVQEVARADKMQDWSTVCIYGGPVLSAYTQRGDFLFLSYKDGSIMFHLPLFSRAPPRGVFWGQSKVAIALDHRVYIIHALADSSAVPPTCLHQQVYDCLWIGDSLLFYITSKDIRLHGFIPRKAGISNLLGASNEPAFTEFDVSLISHEKEAVVLTPFVPLATVPVEYASSGFSSGLSPGSAKTLAGIPLGQPLKFASSLIHDTIFLSDLGFRLYPIRIKDPELKMKIAQTLSAAQDVPINFKDWEGFVSSR